MNLDNGAARRVVELCYRTNKTLCNPIIDWTNADVWEFIRAEGIPYCGLYDESCKRLGCVGCPLGGYASQRRELERWPTSSSCGEATVSASVERSDNQQSKS